MEQSFETAFERLEHILQALNEGQVTLDESLKLFEEADKLINNCGKELVDAEKKIETLIKNRNSEIELNEEGTPLTEAFHHKAISEPNASDNQERTINDQPFK